MRNSISLDDSKKERLFVPSIFATDIITIPRGFVKHRRKNRSVQLLCKLFWTILVYLYLYLKPYNYKIYAHIILNGTVRFFDILWIDCAVTREKQEMSAPWGKVGFDTFGTRMI